jgi:hypothetical protein
MALHPPTSCTPNRCPQWRPLQASTSLVLNSRHTTILVLPDTDTDSKKALNARWAAGVQAKRGGGGEWWWGGARTRARRGGLLCANIGAAAAAGGVKVPHCWQIHAATWAPLPLNFPKRLPNACGTFCLPNKRLGAMELCCARCALLSRARGQHVVNSLWLLESLVAGRFLPKGKLAARRGRG